MLDTIRGFLPAWAFALIVIVLSCVLIGLTTWEATGSVTATICAVVAAIVGPGIVGVKAISGSNKPPSDPTATAPVTP